MDSRKPIDYLSPGYAPNIKNSDELRNINCFEYLRNIYLALPINYDDNAKDGYAAFGMLKEWFNVNPAYDPKQPYGDLYTQFIQLLSDEIQDDLSKNNSDRIFLAPLAIDAVYRNRNFALERSAEMIQKIIQQNPIDKLESAIHARMAGSWFTSSLNQTTPTREGSKPIVLHTYLQSRFFGSYRGLEKTSMPSVRSFEYNTSPSSVELRFGTQGELVNNTARVNPIFRAWLMVLPTVPQVRAESHDIFSSTSSMTSSAAASVSAATKSPEEIIQDVLMSQQSSLTTNPTSKIIYVYINNLKHDDTGGEAHVESQLAHELEELEQQYPYVAVITLPADRGIYKRSMTEDHKPSISFQNAYNSMLESVIPGVSQNAVPTPTVTDLYISNKIKCLLYGISADGSYDKNNEKVIVSDLLKKTFSFFGISHDSQLSPAQFHAIYFHFIKYQLTDYILTTLNPAVFNFSCKDAMDRGVVSSLYYHLMKSIESGSPISEQEFSLSLHSAAAMVKGRGMNHNINDIYNALDCHLKANPAIGQVVPWLPKWINDNRPPPPKTEPLQHRPII